MHGVAGPRRGLCVAALCGILSTTPDIAAAELPAELSSPDHGVVCNRERAVCFDRFGRSIGLTEAFLGQSAAQRLLEAARAQPVVPPTNAVFSPTDGVECVREIGPCRTQGEVHAGLTETLYGPRPRTELGAEARAMLYAEWHWRGTRYNNDTESRPADPARYVIRFEADGNVRLRADCNGAGGRYRLDGARIDIEITHSTMAACEPGSLERVFVRDLAAATGYFMKGGKLLLDLKLDTGTMEFERP